MLNITRKRNDKGIVITHNGKRVGKFWVSEIKGDSVTIRCDRYDDKLEFLRTEYYEEKINNGV